MQEQQHSVPMVIKSMRDEQCDELYISKQIGPVWNDIKKDELIEMEETTLTKRYRI